MNNEMIFDLNEVESLTSLSNKITAIMATSQAPIRFLGLAIGSLLLRSEPEYLEHFIVCINGNDPRLGETILQDKKQAFLEEIRLLKVNNRDMPITIIRAWSRIGHAQSIEMAIPWVHTDHYLLMHDDVIILNKDWLDKSVFNNNVAILYNPPLLFGGVNKRKYKEGLKLSVPHMNSTFLVCKKSILNSLPCRWTGYHIETNFKPTEKFVEFHTLKKHIENKDDINNSFCCLSMDIGSWVYYELQKRNYQLLPMKTSSILHFGSASWSKRNISFDQPAVYELEHEMEKIPGLYEIYRKYCL